MNGTTKTIVLIAAAGTWATVHIVALVQHFDVGSTFDPAFSALVGAILVTGNKDKKTPKD